MDIFACPLCGAVTAVEAVSPSQTVRCPRCGGLFQARMRPDGDDVIDVHAEVIGEDRKPQDDATPDDSGSRGGVYVWEDDRQMQGDFPPGRVRGYVRYSERYYRDESGCCLGIGCALVFLICFLLLRGCLSILF